MAVNGFRKSFFVKPAYLAATENRISEKWFQFDRNFTPLTRKWFYTFILPSNHFRVTRKREREQEKEREREKERRESRDRSKPSSPISSKAEFAEIVRRDHWHCADRAKRQLWLREAPITRSADRDRAKCLDLMIFFWVLFVFWGMNDIIYSFGNRENVRKYEQQVENMFSMVFPRTKPNIKKYFLKYFLKCDQTHENIFLSKK